MRIAYLVNEYPKVSHTFIRREIAALEAVGVEVVRCTIRQPSSDLVDESDRAESARTLVLLSRKGALLGNLVRVAATRMPSLLRAAGVAIRIGWSSNRGLLRHAAYLVEACTLLHWLAARRVQHLHAHFGTNPSTVATLCRELGGPPFSFTVHGPEELEESHARSFAEKVERAAFVVAASDWVRGELDPWCPPHERRKIRVVHCGVGDTFLHQPETDVYDARRLVCVARLCADKGHMLLLEAASRVAADGRAFDLMLVGDGLDRLEVEERIESLSLSHRVRVTGWKTESEVRDLLLSARALILPSRTEGLPVVIMEAMALGRPVIATDVGAVSELVETGVTGWLIPAGSVDALALAMSEVLDSPADVLARMGRNGADRITPGHDASREAARLMDLFSESLERGDEVAGEDRSILAVSANGPGQTGGANRVGIVVIGRNEGERLVRCLASVSQRGAPFVYVDSGSSDDSVYHARQLGALVVELDSSEPFTAARARNAGFAELIRAHPEVELVQFVDGDCELRAGWLQAGGSFLSSSPDVGVVCGHLRERAPSSGRYQRLADVEWAGPPGDVRVIGGTCMVRVRTFLSVGGFNTRMIGGEEPEFCLRLSACGLRVVRIDHEMALHEMSIFSVGPWWRRCVRAGHSYAEIYALHRATRDPHWRRKLLSIAVWAVFLPLLILWAASERSAWSLVLLSAYGVLFARIVRSTHARGVDTRTAALYACACIIGKFAELEGVFRFAWARLVRRRPSRLIEYRKRSVEP